MSNKLIDAGALRQFKHNDGSDGFVSAYDIDIVNQVVAKDALDAARYRWLRERHDGGSENWFVYGAETDDLNISIDKAMKENSP